MKTVASFWLVLSYLAVTHAWTCKEPPQLFGINQIDAGQGVVVATDKNHNAYILKGSSWCKLGTQALKHVSVGPAGIWGVDPSEKVYKYIASDFVPSTGATMKQVDAGGDGYVVGVASSGYTTNCLKSTTAQTYKATASLSWTSLGKDMKYYSCGPLGCWGIDASDAIYFTRKITATTCKTAGWQKMPGAAVMVEVATDGSVFVATRGGGVFQRTGISSGRPYGSNWAYIKTCLPITHLSYDLGRLWIVTGGGILLECTH